MSFPSQQRRLGQRRASWRDMKRARALRRQQPLLLGLEAHAARGRRSGALAGSSGSCAVLADQQQRRYRRDSLLGQQHVGQLGMHSMQRPLIRAPAARSSPGSPCAA